MRRRPAKVAAVREPLRRAKRSRGNSVFARGASVTIKLNMSRIFYALLLIATLSSCATTPMVWTMADGEAGNPDADLQECRQLAADEMWRMSWDRMWPPRFYNPRFMPPYYLNRRPFWYDFPDSFEREEALVEFCMHSKGYRLEALPY